MNTHPFPVVQRPQSIVETLFAWREIDPARTALTVLRECEQIEREATYRELHEQVIQVAAGLRSQAARGERVLLLLPTGVEFVAAFYGCLAAGIVAIPAHHPQQPRKLAQWQKLQAIVENSGATLIIAPDKSLEVLATMAGEHGLFAGCDVQTYGAVLAAGAAQPGAPLALPGGSDLAFLQYTSGSTGTPKGVMITHANIIDNQMVIADLMGHTRETRVVSWLPLYHDMGLSAVLQMGSVGCSLVLMPPVAFIQKPMRWLKAISDHRANTSGGPNFAYQLAAAALASPEAAQEKLDLSNWQLAFCGAEPINRQTVSEFIRAAEPLGFAADAFHACYGMAEATVQVTGALKGQGIHYLEVSNSQLSQGRLQPAQPGDVDLKSLVSCGSPRAGNQICVVAPDGSPVVSENHVGEIWVRGGSVGAGYYGNPAATLETFGARLSGDEGGPFMRTGDLGVIKGGNLYVTGRVKDMLIIRGRNLYPQDVEDCVQDSVPDLRRGCGAAISMALDGQETLVIVQEVGRTQRRNMDMADTLSRIVVAIGEDFGLVPYQVVLVEPATIEKTSSGKIARALCRRAYLQGQLRPIGTWTQGEPEAAEEAIVVPVAATAADGISAQAASLRREIELRVTGVAAWFLKTDATRLSRTKSWTELGFDSVGALQLALKVQQSTGIKFDAAELWECPNIDELVIHLAGVKGAAEMLAQQAAPAPASREAASAVLAAPTVQPTEATLAALSEAQAEALLMKELSR